MSATADFSARALETTPRCATCAHWQKAETLAPTWAYEGQVRVCAAVGWPVARSPHASIINVSVGHRSLLATAATFGCIQHTPVQA